MNGSYESIEAIIKFLTEGNLSPNIGYFIIFIIYSLY